MEQNNPQRLATPDKHRDTLFPFIWRRDSLGYDLSKKGLIVRRGGRLVEYDPAAVSPRLHLTFANLGSFVAPVGHHPDMQQALLDFIQQFGFLGSPSWGAEGREGAEPLDYIDDQRRQLSLFMDFSQNAPRPDTTFNKSAPPMSLRLVPGRGGRFRIAIEPQSLIGWIWLQVAQDCENGLSWSGKPCLACGASMGRGPGGYRADARFCSNLCRANFSRQRRSNPSKTTKGKIT